MINLSLIPLIIVVLFVLYVWSTYNSLISLRQQIKEAVSRIDTELIRRSDLIPRLVETIKGYAKHEREVFEEITKARSGLLNAQTPKEKLEANNTLTSTLKSLFAVAENYPDLKANQNFLALQEELRDTEDKVRAARQFYISVVRDYNSRVQSFPTSIFASLFKFDLDEEYIEASEDQRKAPEVKF